MGLGRRYLTVSRLACALVVLVVVQSTGYFVGASSATDALVRRELVNYLQLQSTSPWKFICLDIEKSQLGTNMNEKLAAELQKRFAFEKVYFGRENIPVEQWILNDSGARIGLKNTIILNWHTKRSLFWLKFGLGEWAGNQGAAGQEFGYGWCLWFWLKLWSGREFLS